MDEYEFAKLVGLSAFLIRKIEMDYPFKPDGKPNPSQFMLMAKELNLIGDEKELFFELVAKFNENILQSVTPILDYFQANAGAREAMKEAIKNGMTEADLKAFAQQIKNRNIGHNTYRNDR